MRQKKIHHCHDPDIYSFSCGRLYQPLHIQTQWPASQILLGRFVPFEVPVQRSSSFVRCKASLILLDVRVGQDALGFEPPAGLLESPCLDAVTGQLCSRGLRNPAASFSTPLSKMEQTHPPHKLSIHLIIRLIIRSQYFTTPSHPHLPNPSNS
jgi:hypothetical protein